MKNEKNPILIVEDLKVDQIAIQRSVEVLKISNPLIVKENGKEALEYLKGEKNERPILILLDLKMPVMDGIEFLQERKNSMDIFKIPVVVFTTSSEEKDKAEAYELGIAGYIVKPPTHDKFTEVLRNIDLYWTLCEQPGV